MRRLVLGIAVAVTSLIPVLGMADDQQIADYIKSRLQAEQQQGNLRGFNVDMRVENGTVWFKGHVSNSTQETTILKTAQQAGHLGVTQVVDDISVRTTAAPAPAAPAPTVTYQNTGYQQQQQQQQPMPAYQQQPMPAYQQQPMPATMQASPYRQTSVQEPVAAAEGVANNGTPLPFATSGAPNGPSMMPASYGSVGMPSEAPNLPGYAWPGYAAHPNYAGVTYPRQYSASAWPYIGPFYPYPQVPLGWRKVSLEWDDGWWMLDFSDK
jgi:hypothetical protein